MGDKVEPRRNYISEFADFNRAGRVAHAGGADGAQFAKVIPVEDRHA